MASFQEHINQANNNLRFLEKINSDPSKFWDWQVTVSFYVAVHLVNAHIADKSKLSYRSHEQVNNAINPYVLSPAKFSETNYLAYSKLQGLARRARYLCSDDITNKENIAHFTYDKHFARAIRHLDVVISFIKNEYKITFPLIKITCIEIKKGALSNFEIL